MKTKKHFREYEYFYSGFVDIETTRITFLAAVWMKLKVTAVDVGSAYIQAFTREEIISTSGFEF